MKRHIRMIAVLAVVLLSALPLAAAPGDKHLYLVVLDPSGPALDVRGHGGDVEFEATDRMAIRLPEAALEGIILNPRVRYIQRLVEGGETAARSASAVRVDANPIAHAGSSWTSGTYVYDGSGNLAAAGPTSDGVTNRFTYDAYGRLTSSKVHVGAAAHDESYEYDRFGNLKARTTDGTRVDLPVDPATNRMQGGARFDAAGNQIYDPLWGDLSYDAAGMLTSRGYATLYAYDASDERIVQIQNYGAGNTRWRWTPRNLANQSVREWESFGRFGWEYPLWLTDYISAGGQLLAADLEEAEGGERHFHLDHLGTPRFATNADGEIVASHILRPFGAEIMSTSQNHELPRRFTGHERDYGAAGTYLDYMHARYYNAQWGRFLSVDPGGFDPAHPQSWNRYTYVSNNPLMKLDPDGREELVIGPPRPATLAKWSAEQRTAENMKNAVRAQAAAQGDGLVATQVEGKSTLRGDWVKQNGPVPTTQQIDHVIDRQLGGADKLSNAQQLDGSVNASNGARTANGLRGKPPGTRITSISYTVLGIAPYLSTVINVLGYSASFKQEHGRQPSLGELSRYFMSGDKRSDQQVQRDALRPST